MSLTFTMSDTARLAPPVAQEMRAAVYRGAGRVAMEQVNHATQNVAASSEESAAAAQELQSQAEEMRGLVNGFRLTGHENTRVTRPSGSVPKSKFVRAG